MSETKIPMWCGQSEVVLKTLAEAGRYTVKRRYVQQKFGSEAWIFETAYQYLAGKAAERIPRPADAESPVWMYKESYHVCGGGAELLELYVPKEELLLFDSRKWNKVLNLQYLAVNEAEEQAFEKWLRGRGVTDFLKVFSTPYYPTEKRKVVESWERLFIEEDIPDAFLQGMTWEIRSEWRRKIYC